MIRQLDLFAAFAAAEVAAAKPVHAASQIMSCAEMRKCLEVERDLVYGRGAWLDKQLIEWEKREIAAGRMFVSKKYLKMLNSY